MEVGNKQSGHTWQSPPRRVTLAGRPTGDATNMLDIAFAKPALPKSGALVLLIHEGEKPSGLWTQLDEATGGAITRAFEVAEFKGAKGKTCAILAPGAGLSRLLAGGPREPGGAH